MGANPRVQPDRLGVKLFCIRERLKFTQSELAEKLSRGQIAISKQHISAYEKGVREPGSIILLRYSRLIGINVEILIDDDLELPK